MRANRRLHMAGLLILVLVATTATAWMWRRASRADDLTQRLAAAQGTASARAVSCSELRKQAPTVLLALGQSNAGNHGQRTVGVAPTVFTFYNGRCWEAQDPLPGGTGDGGSLWSPLVAQLQAAAPERPILLVVLAVDASSSAEWTASASPLRARLDAVLRELLLAQLAPYRVLWQQGEADARAGVPAARYRENLLQLQRHLEETGVRAPIVLAKSTVCRSAPSGPIRQAVDGLVASAIGYEAGPDTDVLVDAATETAPASALRRDGCHFSALGLQQAARLWAQILLPKFVSLPRAPAAR